MKLFKSRVTMGGLIVFLLVAIAVTAILGNLTNGFQDWTKETISGNLRPVNEDNLYNANCVTLESGNDGSGIVITVNDDGSIKVKGERADTYTYEIGKITLAAGTYTFTAIDGGARSTAYVTAYADSTEYYADFTGNTFTLAEETTLSIRLTVVGEAEIDFNVRPVIVEGDEAGSFYA